MTYLDYNATTPVDPIVVDSMMPFFTDTFGNPSSTHHDSGRTASHAVEEARKQVAEVVLAKAFEDYNKDRFHSALGYLTPDEFVGKMEVENK